MKHQSIVTIQLDSVALEGLEHWLEACLVKSPSARRTGMDGLSNLHTAGRAHDTRIRMEFEAGWIPLETDEVDQAPGVSFQVGDQLFVPELETRRVAGVASSVSAALIVRQPPRNVVPIGVPWARSQAGLPAGKGDVARIAPADDRL